MIASDQKRLVVDAFARYRIHDPLKFYQTVSSIEGANSRLATLLISALRRVLGESTFIELVRDERPQLTQRIREQLDREAAAFGIDVVDVRIRRADLPEQNSQAVYQRMQTERQREAAEFRAQGNQRSQEIRARADRDVTVLIADATSRAEQIRGEGDAERNRIFAEAFGRDRGFLRVLPLHAGPGGGSEAQRHAYAAEARFGVLPLLHRSLGQAARGEQEPIDRRGRAEAIGSPVSHRVPPAAVRSEGRVSARCLISWWRSALCWCSKGSILAAFPVAAKQAMASVLETPEIHAADSSGSFRRCSASWSYGWCAADRTPGYTRTCGSAAPCRRDKVAFPP